MIINKSLKIPDNSFYEQVKNKENEIIQENELKNSSSKEDYCSALFHEKTQKENNEKTFTGTKVYDKSNEIDYSGK